MGAFLHLLNQRVADNKISNLGFFSRKLRATIALKIIRESLRRTNDEIPLDHFFINRVYTTEFFKQGNKIHFKGEIYNLNPDEIILDSGKKIYLKD